MGLVIRNAILRTVEHSYTNASKIGITIEKRILSSPYEFVTGSVINAEIMEIVDTDSGKIGELSGVKIKFMLIKGSVSKDYLMIHNEDWPKLRDYGLLAGEVEITIKIEEGSRGSDIIEIYPKRDIVIDG